jgi:hypothetical protein
VVDLTVRRERLWTTAGATPARELVWLRPFSRQTTGASAAIPGVPDPDSSRSSIRVARSLSGNDRVFSQSNRSKTPAILIERNRLIFNSWAKNY